MNRDEAIRSWRANPLLAPKTAKGWTVEFALDAQGTSPALDYMEGTSPTSDSAFEFTQKNFDTLDGLLTTIRADGPAGLHGGKAYVNFIGNDAAHGMCELRVITNRGHRFLCFRRDGKQFVISHAFRKPAQEETPHQHKTRAVQILQGHESRRGRAQPKGQAPARRTQ